MIANPTNTDLRRSLELDPNYQALKQLKNENKLLIYYIFSLPRSLSTALQIAITEGADGQINEPFYHADHGTVRYDAQQVKDNFHRGCELILSRFNSLLGTHPKGEKGQVKLVVNDIVGDLTEIEFGLLLSISNHFAITVRDPALQMRSFLVRTGNDLHTLCGTQLDDITALAQCQQTDKVEAVRVAIDTNQNSWLNIERYVPKLIDYVVRTPGATLAIIDGYMLQMGPHSLMRELCQKWGMVFTENMVNGWQKARAGAFYSPVSFDLDGKINGWHADAISSIGFKAPKDEKIDEAFFNIIPDEHKAYVAEAERIYHKIMLNRDYVILPTDSVAIETMRKNDRFVRAVFDAYAWPALYCPSFDEKRRRSSSVEGPPQIKDSEHRDLALATSSRHRL